MKFYLSVAASHATVHKVFHNDPAGHCEPAGQSGREITAIIQTGSSDISDKDENLKKIARSVRSCVWLWADARSPRKSNILISCPQSSFDAVSSKSSCLCWCGGKQDAVKAEIFVDVFSYCSQCGALLLQGWGRAVLCSLERQCSESRSQEIKRPHASRKTPSLNCGDTSPSDWRPQGQDGISAACCLQIKSKQEAHFK